MTIDLDLNIYDAYRMPSVGRIRIVEFPISSRCHISINDSFGKESLSVHFYNKDYHSVYEKRCAAVEITATTSLGFIYDFYEPGWDNYPIKEFIKIMMDEANTKRLGDFREWLLFNLI